MKTRHIGISLGLIDSLSDGLGEFSTQVCERVAAAAAQWQRELDVRFTLHLPERWRGRFGPEVDYLAARKSQGWWPWWGGRRFDVWHSLNQLGRLTPPLATRHALLTIHDLNSVHWADPRTIQRDLRKLRRRLRTFDAVTTLTRHVAGDVRQHLGWTGPLSIVPNGARDLTRSPQEPIAGVDDGFLLHLSRMAPSKNPDSLVALARAWPEQSFVFAGPRGADAQRVAAQVQGLRNVQLLSEVSEAQKAWLYAHCAAFLFPSWTEGFGLPPLEAMHFGKPVFLARLTSLPEVGGECAGYFDDFDGPAMRRVVESELPRLRSQAQAIRAHAAGFSWDRAVTAYLGVYRRLLAS